MVLYSASLQNGCVAFWINLCGRSASVHPRSSLCNTFSFLSDDLDIALNNTLLASFRLPIFFQIKLFGILGPYL